MPYDDELNDDDLDISIGRRGRGHGPGGTDIPNYLTQAILVTLCCCVPFGIVAIVNAAQVNTHIARGDYEAARKASDQAKMWSTIGFVGGLIVGVFYIIVQVLAEMGGHARF
jgi:hypothetical protein